jgi:UDP-N-acetylglucosamine:LPS N-acetylglucosamine transferase
LVTGPLFNDWWKLNLVDGVRVIPFDPYLSSTFASADVIICQAGYNTIAEVTQLGVPAICVPADRDMDDQYARAEQAAASNRNFHVCMASEGDRLTNLIDQCLQAPPGTKFRDPVSPSGAQKAAEALLQLVAHSPSAANQTPLSADKLT